MAYRREVLLRLDGTNPDDAEIIRAFYLSSGIRELLNHLVSMAASKHAQEEAAWKKIAQRLGKSEIGELGHVFFDHLTAEVTRRVYEEDKPAE